MKDAFSARWLAALKLPYFPSILEPGSQRYVENKEVYLESSLAASRSGQNILGSQEVPVRNLKISCVSHGSLVSHADVY